MSYSIDRRGAIAAGILCWIDYDCSELMKEAAKDRRKKTRSREISPPTQDPQSNIHGKRLKVSQITRSNPAFAGINLAHLITLPNPASACINLNHLVQIQLNESEEKINFKEWVKRSY